MITYVIKATKMIKKSILVSKEISIYVVKDGRYEDQKYICWRLSGKKWEQLKWIQKAMKILQKKNLEKGVLYMARIFEDQTKFSQLNEYCY